MSEHSPAIRAGDSDRERLVGQLGDHLVAGRLTLDEFAERVDAAHAAKTLEDLELLTRDLPAVIETATRAAAVPERRPGARWVVAVMGGADRRRRWRVSERLNVVTLMGGANLDLLQAEIEAPEVTITIFAIMGGANVAVPEGVPVDVTGFSFMGGRNEQIANVPPLPGAPQIRIRAFSIMGGINIRSRPLRSEPLVGPPPPPALPPPPL